MKSSLFALTVALFSGSTIAGNTINFDYVGAGYAKHKLEDMPSQGGYTVEASKKFADRWVASAQYSSTSDTGDFSSSIEMETNTDYWRIGGAYLISQDDNSVFELAASFNRLDIDNKIIKSKYDLYIDNASIGRGENINYRLTGHTNTHTLKANYHYAFAESISLVAGIGYEYLTNAEQKHELFYQVGVNYNFAQNVTLSALYRNIDIYETQSITLRYNF
ncbi:hypothetical protein J8M20_08855 [Pseudoalteromonas luteoviolacea]|uniref:hypothetical protein n=1 Tax=Pseudoalteromonas luteoviolacea TaxID=43657 RepID=UPI001B366D1D|nr:hypothetical protein [Pseudoalteromonas luteoviolacea]MBQ4811445.1 hypothetical protein [Pseudoalteromonas luteoviolacea]